ncbi:MAG: helix-turn-helix domain-containing protein [Clostridiales bacterium]|jgi:sugar diacid utilization regulator|nr:helix-turn-helix domain-containing protein [Eubacteriales bacterium]MDH7565879.1 helix-turn-helix domain-containing protein [Clostridiales bacterium]
MDINLTTIASKLKRYNPKLYTPGGGSAPLKSVKLLLEGMPSLEPDILYIGKASSFVGKLPPSSCVNILCVPDVDIPPEYTGNSNMNLMVLDKKADVFMVFNEIQDVLTAELNLARSSKRLLDTLMDGKGIQHIIDVAYEILGNPICFGDPSTRLIAHKGLVEAIEPIWDEQIRTGKFSLDTVRSLEYKYSFAMVNKSKLPFFVKGGQRPSKISAKVVIGNITVGYLTVIEYENPFKESDLELVALLCDVISSEMQKNRSNKNSKWALFESFLADLLNGNIQDDKTTQEMAQALSLNLEENLYILTIDVRQSDIAYIYLIHSMYLPENIAASSKSIMYKDYIVILVSCSKKGKLFSDTDLKSFVEFLKENNLYAGLSRCFHSLMELNYYYMQSLKAIELGIRKNKEKAFFTYEEYALYHLLDTHSNPAGLKEFCHPSILILMDYDRENNTRYTHTLYIYIVNRGNQAKSANALHIHRSTLIYRIEKIQAIMDLDLDDANIMHHLYVSFLILRFTNQLDSEPFLIG